jgi:hypothetical protein
MTPTRERVTLTDTEKNQMLDSIMPTGKTMRWYFADGKGAGKDDIVEWVAHAVTRVMEKREAVDVESVRKNQE